MYNYIKTMPTKMGESAGWATTKHRQLINENALNQALNVHQYNVRRKKIVFNKFQLLGLGCSSVAVQMLYVIAFFN